MTDTAHEIARINQIFMECVRTRDENRFAGLYTADAIVMTNNAPLLIGRTGAAQFFAALQKKGIAEIRLTTLEVESMGDSAWERGASAVHDHTGAVIGRGNYVVIWKRTLQGWQLYRDIMNTAAEPL